MPEQARIDNWMNFLDEKKNIDIVFRGQKDSACWFLFWPAKKCTSSPKNSASAIHNGITKHKPHPKITRHIHPLWHNKTLPSFLCMKPSTADSSLVFGGKASFVAAMVDDVQLFLYPQRPQDFPDGLFLFLPEGIHADTLRSLL